MHFSVSAFAHQILLSSAGLCSWDSSLLSHRWVSYLFATVSVLFILYLIWFLYNIWGNGPISPWKYSFLWFQWQYYFKLFSTFKATQLISNLFKSTLCTNLVNTSVCRATFHTLDSLNSWQTSINLHGIIHFPDVSPVEVSSQLCRTVS